MLLYFLKIVYYPIWTFRFKLKLKSTWISIYPNFLVKTVPPRWKVEPTDVSVERNRHVILNCQAEGVPTPTVIWKKATGWLIVLEILAIFLLVVKRESFCGCDNMKKIIPFLSHSPTLRQQIRRLRGNTRENIHEIVQQRFTAAAKRQGGSRRLLHLPSEQWHWLGNRQSHSTESELYVNSLSAI